MIHGWGTHTQNMFMPGFKMDSPNKVLSFLFPADTGFQGSIKAF